MKKFGAEVLYAILAFCLIVGLFNFKSRVADRAKVAEADRLIEGEVNKTWGICLTDSARIDSLKIKPHQSLSDILVPLGITHPIIDQIARNARDVFDVRKIQSGKNYFLLYPAQGALPSYLVYEENIKDYYVFHLTDSLAVIRGEKKVDTLSCRFSGIIQSSLWNSLSDRGISPVLAVDMADIFAWTIDFFGIQKGDRYKVLYDELYVENKFAGFGRIHAALFESSGHSQTAYYYMGEEQTGYFDAEGQSLQKAFLKAPLKFSRISSRYSHGRMHPVLKIRRPHHGVDYAAPEGTPVYSIGEGVVVKKAHQIGGGGNYLTIKHNSVYSSQYMHLKAYAKGMAPGVRVSQGQLIGYVGKTGLTSGP
ncbi:MAG TPA: M23 family metallopeptidase, partial [Prolixibacteraceae bacterium]|nr:M23 family metallopeptidase [Prolixibacteraceae bacterium]